MAGVSEITPVTAATRTDLPAPCVDCVFWQHDRLVSDERHKAAWTEGFVRRHGAFGAVLRQGDGVRGMVQFGPASAFPRALALPAGPPGADAALITCTFIEGPDPAGTYERLLLEALAQMKADGLVAVEAFAVSHAEDTAGPERYAGHHTLADRDLLESLGFTIVRVRGPVALMRIELGGLQPATGLLARALRAARAAAEPHMRGAPA